MRDSIDEAGAALVAALHADPSDDARRLVLADWLQQQGDERGELIALGLADRRGTLVDPDGLARLLELAAAYGFAWPPDTPPLPTLPWRGGGCHPVQYRVEHDGLPSAEAMAAHARRRVCRDHEHWCERYDELLILRGELVDRPQRGPAPEE